jgi:hypothetical protein
MTVYVLACEYRPCLDAVKDNDRRGCVAITLDYQSRTRELIAPISRISQGTYFIFEMPKGWGELFGTETGYTKAVIGVMSSAVLGDQLAFPIELHRA